VPGCRSIYYGAMEKIGIEKRELMVSRVEGAREAQDDAKEQFQSALEQFQAVVRVPPSKLEATYSRLNANYERCSARADEVRRRIDGVEHVSESLFREWRSELSSYSDPGLRAASEQQMRETRRRYDELVTAMRRAEASMRPVLAKFRDQVLFLKHNLNAQAVASLQGELAGIQANVGQLIREMESAIAEADRFLASMRREP